MEEKRGGTAFTLSRRIGSTTYLVNVYCSDTATETFEDKIKRMIRNESMENAKNYGIMTATQSLYPIKGHAAGGGTWPIYHVHGHGIMGWPQMSRPA